MAIPAWVVQIKVSRGRSGLSLCDREERKRCPTAGIDQHCSVIGTRDAASGRACLEGIPCRDAAPAVLVTPLLQPPQAGRFDNQVFALGMTHAGFGRLTDYLWSALVTSPNGEPIVAGRGFSTGSRFYAATGTYSATYTCNTWPAEALQVGGLPVTARGVVFAHQIVQQITALLHQP